MKVSETSSGSILSARAGILALVLLLLGVVIGAIVEEDEQSNELLFNKNEPDLFLERASHSPNSTSAVYWQARLLQSGLLTIL